MNKYSITVTESDCGRLTVTDVQKVVKINQHRTDTNNLRESPLYPNTR